MAASRVLMHACDLFFLDGRDYIYNFNIIGDENLCDYAADFFLFLSLARSAPAVIKPAIG